MLYDMNNDKEKTVPYDRGTVFSLPFFTILSIYRMVIVDDTLGHTTYSLYNYYSFLAA
jgi:hypothetical protein